MEKLTKGRSLVKGRLLPSSSKASAAGTTYSMATADSGIVMREEPDRKDDKKGRIHILSFRIRKLKLKLTLTLAILVTIFASDNCPKPFLQPAAMERKIKLHQKRRP